MSSLQTSLAEFDRLAACVAGQCGRNRASIECGRAGRAFATTDHLRPWNAPQRNFGGNSHP